VTAQDAGALERGFGMGDRVYLRWSPDALVLLPAE
jgi:hypothetical protein